MERPSVNIMSLKIKTQTQNNIFFVMILQNTYFLQ